MRVFVEVWFGGWCQGVCNIAHKAGQGRGGESFSYLSKYHFTLTDNHRSLKAGILQKKKPRAYSVRACKGEKGKKKGS